MSLIRRAISNARELRSTPPGTPWGSAVPLSNGQMGGAGAAGAARITEQAALSIAATYASVRIIADTVATAPLYAYRGYEESKTRLKQPELLIQPYAEISRIDWMVQAATSLALRGNFYGWIIARDARSYPTQIMPIHPDRASVRRNSEGEVEYRFGGVHVPIDDVFHIRYISVPGSLVGLSPIENLRITFGLAQGADAYGEAFFRNSAYPGGVIEVPDDLNEEETRDLVTAWKMGHQGAGLSSLPAVLTSGAKWQQITLSPEAAQFISSRQFSVYELAMVFGVPPHWLGQQDRTPTATGIEDQVRMFNNITANGYLQRFEEAFSTPAISPRGQYVEFDLDSRLKGDMLTRMQSYTLARNASIWTVNEIRKKEGNPPLPDGVGDNILLPMNMTTIDVNTGLPMPGTQALKPVQNGGEPQPPTGLDDPPKKNPPKGQDQ